MGGLPFVLDINVLVQAVLSGKSTFETWPVLPPRTTNSAADCVGVMNDCREFALWLSPHVLTNTTRVLAEAGVSREVVEDYLDILVEISGESGGGVVDPARSVFDCDDYEDNVILDLASDIGAVMIVSDEVDLTSMSPWRATPILRPAEFASRVDATRRARRR